MVVGSTVEGTVVAELLAESPNSAHQGRRARWRRPDGRRVLRRSTQPEVAA